MPSEVICGVNAVLEVLRSGRRKAIEVFVAEGKKRGTLERIVAEASRRNIPIHATSRQHIAELSRVEKHQGVAARVDVFAYTPLQQIIQKAKDEGPERFVVLLDEIIDPQNVGSLIRTAHVSGAAGLVVTKDRCAPIGPATTKAAAGATEYLPIAQVTNLVRAIEMLQEGGFWIIGAEGESAQSLYDYDFTGNYHAIVLGGEGKGLRRLIREKCDALLAIPMKGAVGSYNVSVAGGIFMGEVSRQHWVKKHAKFVPFRGKRVDKGGPVS